MNIRISVGDLVAHVFRKGDIRLSFSGHGRSRNLAAIRAHQKIQRGRPGGYQAEVPVTIEIPFHDLVLTIAGRIDGLLESPEETVIEEIKTSFEAPERISEVASDLHWAQAKCYGHMWAVSKGLSSVHLQLTYYHLESDRETVYRKAFSAGELADFFNELVTLFLSWARTLSAWEALRDSTISALPFPFPAYRPGQREMAVAVYRTVRDSQQFLIQAATGIGKTLAALFPSVKALGESRIDKIFFLTARTTGKLAAETALDRMREKGLRIKSLTLTAKDRVCPHPEAHCAAEECPMAKGHFDRVRAALETLFPKDNWNRETILSHSRIHAVCPFEFSLDLALAADVIICDYNYAFDPRVYLRRFFDETTGRYAFLVDEAHNLADRGREMFSAGLGRSGIVSAQKIIGTSLPTLQKTLGKINAWLSRGKKAHPKPVSEVSPPVTLYPFLWSFVHRAEQWLVSNEKSPLRDTVMDLYYAFADFLETADRYDDAYATCHTPEDNGEFTIRLFCIDPSRQLGPALLRGTATILFSGTLRPFSFFQSILGCRKDAGNLSISSPFPPENRCTVVHQAISTLYRRREASREMLSRTIQEIVRRKSGNYLVFFPSYAYLELIRPDLANWIPEARLLIQTPGMTEPEREAYLDAFRAAHPHPLVGLAVMGGAFGEGIDLLGDLLTGAVIIGVGLPAIGIERELIRNYFDGLGCTGFDFAYRFPGITRVLQAAGRVIRSGADRGLIVLLDERFCLGSYRSLLPQEWRIHSVRSTGRLTKIIHDFWEASPRGLNDPSPSHGPQHQRNGHQGAQRASQVAEHHHQQDAGDLVAPKTPDRQDIGG